MVGKRRLLTIFNKGNKTLSYVLDSLNKTIEMTWPRLTYNFETIQVVKSFYSDNTLHYIFFFKHPLEKELSIDRKKQELKKEREDES